jgi:hypothetical protein
MRELLDLPGPAGGAGPSQPALRADQYDGALRWLTVTDQKVSCELGRALVEVQDGRLHERQGHARWSTYVRAFVGRTLRWTQYEMRRERALKDLPGLAAAFESGVLNKSKLRVLLGVVTPQSERLWLERARSMSVRELELAVGAERAARQEAAPAEPDEDAGVDADGERRVVRHVVAAPPGVAVLLGQAVELARKVAGYQIGAGEAVGLMAAETIAGLAGAGMQEDPDGGSAAGEPGAGDEGRACGVGGTVAGRTRRAPVTDGSHTALVEELGRGWAGQHRLAEEETRHWADLPWDLPRVIFEAAPPADAPAHRRVVYWAAAAGRLDAVRGRLLRILEDSMLARHLRFEGLGQYVRERLGMSLREARELIGLDRALSGLPAAFRMYAAGRLTRSAAWLVAKVATTSRGDRLWTRSALTHSLRWLEASVEAVELAAAADPGAWRPDGLLPPGDVSFAALTRMCSPPDRDNPDGRAGAGKGRGPMARIRLRFDDVQYVAYRQAVGALRRRFGEQRPEWWYLAVMARHFIDEHATSDDRARASLGRKVIRRDNYTCAACECLERGGLEADHIWFRSAGGPDAECNEVSACAAHHRHIKHELGALRLSGQAPDRLIVRMGKGDDAVSYRNDRRLGVRVTDDEMLDDPWVVGEQRAAYSVV